MEAEDLDLDITFTTSKPMSVPLEGLLCNAGHLNERRQCYRDTRFMWKHKIGENHMLRSSEGGLCNTSI